MNRYEIIKDQFFADLNRRCFGLNLNEAMFHLVQVATFNILIGKKEGFDIELCAIAGLLHDSATYLNNNSHNHALLSGEYARKLMVKSGLFEDLEIDMVTQAIANHSSKKRIDDKFSEILKASDVASSYLLNGCNLVARKHEPYLHYLKKLNLLD